MKFSAIIASFTLWGLAAPAALSPRPGVFPRAAGAVQAASALLKIAPTSGSCANPPMPGECATADEAAPFVIQAFQDYGIYDYPSMAAVLATMAFESGDFKYNIHHFPSPNPGQGTRNMQNANFNLMYAQAIAKNNATFAGQLSKITTATTTTGLSNDQLNAILALVLPDQYSFGSGAWFLATQCTPAVRTAVQTQGHAGFAAFLGCVGTSMSEERMTAWEAANAVFGLPNS